jgi:hypothetical protein
MKRDRAVHDICYCSEVEGKSQGAHTLAISKVNFVKIKRLAIERLGSKSILAEVLLQEGDQISSTEFLARLPVWLTLLRRIENDRGNRSE